MSSTTEFMESYVNGKKGETHFYRPSGTVTEELTSDIDLLLKMSRAGDDRSYVLTTCLVMEYRFDEALSILLPGYNSNGRYLTQSLGLKISLLEAFQLIPKHIFIAARIINGIRNNCTHNLNWEKLTEIDSKLVIKMNRLYISRKINTDKGPDHIPTLFRTTSYMATYSLHQFKSDLIDFAKRKPEDE